MNSPYPFPGPVSLSTCMTGWRWTLTWLGLLLITGSLRAGQFGDFQYYSNEAGTITISGYTGSGGAVTIPALIEGLPVTKLDGYLFVSNPDVITSVVLPSSVDTIGEAAFFLCSNLVSIDLGSGITTIQTGAFSYTGLSSITLPTSVTSIEVASFSNSNSLLSITIPAENPYYSTVDGVLFNKSLTTLQECPGGKQGSYAIPGTVTYVSDYAFYGCQYLTTITLPDGLTTIGRGAFYFCVQVAQFTIPSSVTTIGAYAFHGCFALEQVSIPQAVIDIGDHAFKYCTHLLDITVEGSNPNYSSRDGVLFDKSQSILLQCPGGRSGGYAIPAGTTRVENEAFGYCGLLTSVDIPASVSSVGDYAFANCPSLRSVTFAGNAPAIGNGIFLQAPPALAIYYPQGATGYTTGVWQTLPVVAIKPYIAPPLIVANQNGTITLKWPAPSGVTTLAQLKDFIQRSSGVSGWQSVPNSSISLSNGNVIFTDNAPLPGQGFYRLGRL